MSNSNTLPDNKNSKAETIGERIEALMLKNKIDQYTLGTLAGTTQPTISRIMSGKTSNSRNIPKIATVLNTTVEYLVFGTGIESLSSSEASESLRIKENDFMLIRMYDNVSENTENLHTNKNAEDILMLEKSLIPLGSCSDDLRYLKVDDNSMSPKIPVAARVFFNMKDTNVIAGKAYAIKYGHLREQVRILYPQPDGGYRVRVTTEMASEFPEIQVSKQEIDNQTFKVLGRVFSVTSLWE
nr:S24 family peptidase [Acinetobacter oleivorans]